MVEVKMKNHKGDRIPVEKALRILKRKMEKEEVFDEMKEREQFVAPSVKRRLAKKRAAMSRRNG